MNLLILIIIGYILYQFFLKLNLREGLAGSPAALIQLETSSTDVPTMWNSNLRPVLQRGVYFYNPQWTR